MRSDGSYPGEPLPRRPFGWFAQVGREAEPIRSKATLPRDATQSVAARAVEETGKLRPKAVRKFFQALDDMRTSQRWAIHLDRGSEGRTGAPDPRAEIE